MERKAESRIETGRQQRDREKYIELDSYDINILAALLRESRITVVELASAIHLSRSAVTRRISALRDAGVLLSSGASISYQKVGLGISAIVELSSPNHAFESARKYLADRPEVLSVSTVSGRSTFVLNVVALDTEHLSEFVQSLQIYGDTDTRIVFSTFTSSMPLTDRLQKIRRL